jgi:tetratricopeptide (TPR) repeat protein
MRHHSLAKICLLASLSFLNGCAESQTQSRDDRKLERLSERSEFQKTVDIDRLKRLFANSETTPAAKAVLARQQEVFLKVDEWRDRKLFNQCLAELRPLLEMQLRVSGDRNLHLISTYKRLRKTYEGLKDDVQAEKYARLSCDLSDYYFEKNSPDSVNLRLELCKILLKQKKAKEAESMLLQMQKMLEARAISRASEPSVLQRLGELYMDQHRYKEASEVLKLASQKTRERLPDVEFGPTQEQIDGRLKKCMMLLSR